MLRCFVFSYCCCSTILVSHLLLLPSPIPSSFPPFLAPPLPVLFFHHCYICLRAQLQHDHNDAFATTSLTVASCDRTCEQMWDDEGGLGLTASDPPLLYSDGKEAPSSANPLLPSPATSAFPAVTPTLRPTLVVIGGSGMHGTGRSAQMYQCNTRAWVELAECILPRSLFGAAVWENELFVFGGADAYGSGERYDPVANTWSTIAPSHAAVASCCAATVDDHIFVCGGEGRAGLAGLSSYSPIGNFWQQEPPPRTPRAFHTVLVHQRRLLVCGGMGEADEVLSSVEAYDTTTKNWSALPPLPSPRMCHAALVDDGHMYVFGGLDDTGQALASVERLDLQRRDAVWEPVVPLPHPRQGMAAVLFAGRPCLLGGLSPEANILDSDCMLMYNTDSAQWSYSNPDSLAADEGKCRHRRLSQDGRTSTREQLLFSSLGVREQHGAAVLLCPPTAPQKELMAPVEEFEGEYGAMCLPSGARSVFHGVQYSTALEGVSVAALVASELTPNETRVR